MANYDNSIDSKVFVACKLAEISQKHLGRTLQPLLMSGPGMGKSTAVELYAKVAGYELVMLRGNSTSPEVVQGFDVAPTDTDFARSTKHLRPTWFQKVLDNHKAGKKTLLFLDELSTANEYVQGSLLYLILERKCDQEPLPEDTLIVSAANYSNNLSNTMSMLPPLLNRFMIVNIIPTAKDIPHFLSRYEGGILGQQKDFIKDLTTHFNKLNAQENKDVDSELIAKYGEVIEEAIRTEAISMCNDGVLDLGVSDLKDIYQDVEGKEALPGFITMRTLNFLRDMAISSYIAFGSRDGLRGSNFLNLVMGLCGVALSYNKGELVKTDVTNRWSRLFQEIGGDLDKFSLEPDLNEYRLFFEDIRKKNSGATLSVDDADLIRTKIEQAAADPKLKNIDRPIDAITIMDILNKGRETIKKECQDLNGLTGEEFLQAVLKDVNIIISRVTVWNRVISMFAVIKDYIKDPSNGYQDNVIVKVGEIQGSLRRAHTQTLTLLKSLKSKSEELYALVPTVAKF